MRDDTGELATRKRREIERAARAKAALALDWVNRNPIARDAAVRVAGGAGRVAGLGRGAVHTVEGLVDGAVFVSRLANPLDLQMSPPGQAASEQLFRAGQNVARYVVSRATDPRLALQDVQAKAYEMRRDLDPSATQAAPTLAGELQRNFNIGQNQGELAFDVGSLFVGGPGAKAVGELTTVAKAATAKKYIAQGFNPIVAEHLAKPYPSSGMGSHYIPRSHRLPEGLGGGKLPKTYMDGPFNRLAPRGISRGDMYELHFKVDPKSNVNRLPVGFEPKAWNGRTLGLEKYDQFGRLWNGAPGPLKARVGGALATLGGIIYNIDDEENAR